VAIILRTGEKGLASRRWLTVHSLANSDVVHSNHLFSSDREASERKWDVHKLAATQNSDSHTQQIDKTNLWLQ